MSNRTKRSLLDVLPEPTNKTQKLAKRKMKEQSDHKVIGEKSEKNGGKIGHSGRCAKGDNEMYRVDRKQLETAVEQPTLDDVHTHATHHHETEDVFMKAIEEETNRTKGGSTIELKEISQDNLKEGVGGVQREADSLALALGVDDGCAVQQSGDESLYQLNKEAYKKHQIGTLYHTMKKNEVKLLRKDAQNAKMKNDTQRKYGWR